MKPFLSVLLLISLVVSMKAQSSAPPMLGFNPSGERNQREIEAKFD